MTIISTGPGPGERCHGHGYGNNDPNRVTDRNIWPQPWNYPLGTVWECPECHTRLVTEKAGSISGWFEIGTRRWWGRKVRG